jgi:hypothetical protein
MIWTILGVSVAIVAVFCVAVAETLVGKPGFESHREYVAGVLVILGALGWFIGRYLSRRRTARGDESRRFILADFRYWGPLFVTLGIITLFIQPLKKMNEAPVAAAPRPAPKVEVAAAPAPDPPKLRAPVSFPALKMQGVFFRKDRPFAIINGDSYTMGDHVGDVTVKTIDRKSVVVELSGELKLLTLN